MLRTLLLLFLSINLFSFEKEIDRSLLESISNKAIKIGHGTDITAYVFIDPMCPFSRDYITKISKSKELQSRKSYHIFLYRLPKFPSDKLIDYIYTSENPKQTLLDIMVEHKDINLDNFQADLSAYFKVQSIIKVAKQIQPPGRPYAIGYKKGSIFCDVSYGQAACEEYGEY